MKAIKLMQTILFTACIFVIISSLAYADIYWESVIETKGIPQGMSTNVPKAMLKEFNKTQIMKHYYTDYASRTESNSGIMIMNFDEMVMYRLNPKNKTFTKMDMKTMSEDDHSKNMMKGMTSNIKISPTNETKIIQGYNCKKYNVDIMMSKGQYWVSKDIKQYEELENISKKVKKIIDKNPMLKHMNMEAGFMDKLDGFPVQMIMDTMGMTSTTTLKTIEAKKLDKNLFKVPSEYKMVEVDSHMRRHPNEKNMQKMKMQMKRQAQ